MSESDDKKHLSSSEGEITDGQVGNNKTAESAKLDDDMRKHVNKLLTKTAGLNDTAELSEAEEAKNRGISLEQWQDILNLAELKREKSEWIVENFTFSGGRIKAKESLYFNHLTQLTKLPEGLSAVGDLGLRGCTQLTELPEGLSVGRNLSLSGCTALTKLSKGLSVGENLGLIDCVNLTELPEGLSVGRNLSLSGCSGLTELPKGLSVGGDLNLRDCTSLTELPKGLSVGGNLWLIGCIGLTELPERLTVDENIYFMDCTSLVKLPPELSVSGALYLTDNLNEQVKVDAERLHKEGKIGGKIIYL